MQQLTEQLHKEHEEWLEQMTYWHNEMMYFDRVLLRLLTDVKDPSDITQIEKFKSQFDINQAELEKMRKAVMNHEHSLDGKDTHQMDGEHNSMRRRIQEFRSSFYRMKDDFYAFAEKNCYW